MIFERWLTKFGQVMVSPTISATMLTKTTLIAKKQRIPGASVFPFFRRSGRVEQLMVLLPEYRSVCMIPYRRGLASVSSLGIVRLSMDLAAIKSHSTFTRRHVDHLYHYDPDWLLSHERFSGYWALNLIKQSNCVDFIGGKVRNLMFSKDLSLLQRFVMKAGSLNVFRTITPEMMLEPLLPTQSGNDDLSIVSIEPATRGWELNPIWKNWSHE